ncbi:MAG TPA: winged helix-turn-helix transcriptional regulator [Thermoleophilaceae bacterium]|jgi:hypothetical protein|nr:winged helix-turn-helix transcriptional regulator [Thermoleophilaceae bacterium]
MAYNWTTEWPDVYARHEEACPLRNGLQCTCQRVIYRASAKTADQQGRLLSPECDTAIEARDWLRAQRAGPTVSEAIRVVLAAADRGELREPSGTLYSAPLLSSIRRGFGYLETALGTSPMHSVADGPAVVDQLGLAPEAAGEALLALNELRAHVAAAQPQAPIAEPRPATETLPSVRSSGLLEPVARARAVLALLDETSMEALYLVASGGYAPFYDEADGTVRRKLVEAVERLESYGLLERTLRRDLPGQFDYELTARGWSLTDPLIRISEWSAEHFEGAAVVAA